MLPIVPGAHWKPLGGENPARLILGLLALTIGLPYFLLSTTSPLVQSWFARRFPGRSPYRLFALSNLASMLALVGYPFALEPWVTTRMQSYGWSAGYLRVRAAVRGVRVDELAGSTRERGEARRRPDGAALASDGSRRRSRGKSLWCALAATGSFLLLAVTNHICENIAAVPLLWIVPLSIYLLTFILCFDSTRWYRRDLFARDARGGAGRHGAGRSPTAA